MRCGASYYDALVTEPGGRPETEYKASARKTGARRRLVEDVATRTAVLLGGPASGALMVRVDFGVNASLRYIADTQHAVRSLLLDSVDFEVALMPRRDRLARRPYPPMAEVLHTIEELRSADDTTGSFLRDLTDQARVQVVNVVTEVIERLDENRLTYVNVSSSLAVNPWEEVISVAPELTKNGLVVAAVWQGLRNANSILDFIVRASTFRQERRLRRARLEHEAFSQENEAIKRILLAANESEAAERLLRSIENISPEVAESVQLRAISEEDADERRRRLLSIVYSADDQNG